MWRTAVLSLAMASTAFAAVTSGSGGRNLVIEPDAATVELAPFSGGADLSCYTPAEARKLDRTIRDSRGFTDA